MSEIVLKIAVLTAALGLAGCETVGNGRVFSPGQGHLAQSVSIGRSTTADVRRQFGDASVYRLADGHQVWTYQKTDGVPGFVDYVPVVGLFTPFMPRRTSVLSEKFAELF